VPGRNEERRQPDSVSQGQKVLWADNYTPKKAGELAKTHDIAVAKVRGYNGIGHRKYDGQDRIMFAEEETIESRN